MNRFGEARALLAGILLVVFGSCVHAADVTNALDTAGNYTVFSGNQGFGFGAWALSTAGGGCYISGDSPKLFGIWNNSANGRTTAARPFSQPLATGESFSVQLRFLTLDNSSNQNGIQLQDASGQTRFSFWHAGGESADGHYADDAGTNAAKGFAYNYSQTDTYVFTLTSSSNYVFTHVATGRAVSGVLASGGAISQVTFYRANLGAAPGSGDDFKFNTLMRVFPNYAESSRLLAYEGFSYVPGAITNQFGGFGWAGSWTNVAGNAMYIDLDSRIAGANGPAGLDARSQGNFLAGYGGSRVGRLLDCSAGGVFAQKGYLDSKGNLGADGKTLYISFLLQPAVTSSFYEFEFHRGDYGDPGRIAGVGNDTGNATVNLRAPAGAHTALGAGDTAVDFYVVRIDFKSGNDDVRVYRNPTSLAEPGTPTLTRLGVADMSFDRLCVGAWNNYVALDEIRIGSSWADVLGLAVSNLLPPTRQSGGSWAVQFAATPGLVYHLLRATELAGSWQDIGTVNGPGSGLGMFVDANPPTAQAFYRTVTCSTGEVRGVAVTNAAMVGSGIARFTPDGFDPLQTPSLALAGEPGSQGPLAAGWGLSPQFSLVNGNACASLAVPAGSSLYGGGEVTGPLLRNGQTIELWATDTGAWTTDNGRRLYQAHPWVLGVRPDGSAFGVLFDTSWKATLTTGSERIDFQSLGAPFRVFVIDRGSPQAVLQGLAELTGAMPMPPRWALGYHQCRFSYSPDSQVRQIADTFRSKQIPCDALWLDIDYMNGFRDFTFNPSTFPDPVGLNNYLHGQGFHSVCILDPGVKVDSRYSVYQSGTAGQVWVQTASGQEFHGNVWPGSCAFPDYTRPETRSWWAGLCQSFMTNGMDGLWVDMNEPSVSQSLGALATMPYDNWHRGGGGLPAGPHLLYHNTYGRLMAQATYQGELAANPGRRPFVLSRANFLGGQRYAAAWTGDNVSATNFMTQSIPMSLTLGLSGQPFSGPDLGGFIGDATADLWGNWVGFGVFLPFARGHANAGTNAKEPWAFGQTVEDAARIALERRYRLLPYLYTLFYNSSQTGLPIMQPVFFADPADLKLRAEQQAFLVGGNLLVVPSWARSPSLPGGIWQTLSLVDGDDGVYQAELKIRGGAIIPIGPIVRNTTQDSFAPLTLVVCLDANGAAAGTLYRDAGDGWAFQSGQYSLESFSASRTGNVVTVRRAGAEGGWAPIGAQVTVQVVTGAGVFTGTGLLQSGITVNL
jgi:alpha-glucosidase